MCLETVLKGKEKKAALVKLKDTIIVWKVLVKPYKDCDCYTTHIRDFPVYAGEVKFKQPMINNHPHHSSPIYRGGGHFWLTKAGALNWGVDYGCKLVRCTVKKSDINTIGYENEYLGELVVVVKKATFPKYIGKKKK